MRRPPLLAAAAVVLALTGVIAGTATAVADDGPHGAAHALSVRTTLLDKPLVTVDPLPTVAYPSGGEKSVAEVGPDAAGLLTATALHASSQGHDRGVASRAGVADVVVKDLLRAALVTSECRTDGTDVAGSSSVADLTVLGQKVDVNAAPNTVVNVLGVAKVTINEQTREGGVLTVNAIHVTVAGPVGALVSADVTVSQVKCSAAGPVTEPSTPSTTPSTTTAVTTSTTAPSTSTSTAPTSTPGQPTGTTTVTTTTSDDAVGIVPASNAGDLAQTGATGVVAMALVATLLLVGGALVILFARRRRNTASPSTD